MAARTRKIFHDEDTRKRIRAAAIIDRLQAFALGNNPDAMSRTQVATAVALLNKALPDLKTVGKSHAKTNTYLIHPPQPSRSFEEWMRSYEPSEPEQLSRVGSSALETEDPVDRQ
jgi:hypothetical protein